MAMCEVRERVLMNGPGALSEAELLAVYGAEALAGVALSQLAWASVGELLGLGLGETRAATLAVAFETIELGRRSSWASLEAGPLPAVNEPRGVPGAWAGGSLQEERQCFE